MAKQNNLQLYRGQGIPPANSMLEGEVAMDTDKKVLWINNGQTIKPVGIIEGGTTPPADYAGTLWIDNNASPTGIPADFLVANNLTTQAPGAYILDAYQGKVLKDALDAQQLVISGLSDQINNFVDFIYPVGSIYMSVNNVSPATLFGGTWEQIKDTFLLSAGDTYAAGSTGGEATHKLSEAEMPSHTGHVSGMGTGTIKGYMAAGVLTSYGSVNRGWTYINGNEVYPATESKGSSTAHNNMPPYLTVYMWKRTA